MHVELESISSGDTAEIERSNRVFWPERTPAAMREDARPSGREERHPL